MKADLKGALKNLGIFWKSFEHNGKSLSKNDVRKILIYGIQKGYIDTSQITDEEINNLLKG